MQRMQIARAVQNHDQNLCILQAFLKFNFKICTDAVKSNEVIFTSFPTSRNESKQ